MFIDLSDKNIVVAGGGQDRHKKSAYTSEIYKKYYCGGTESYTGTDGSWKGRNNNLT